MEFWPRMPGRGPKSSLATPLRRRSRHRLSARCPALTPQSRVRTGRGVGFRRFPRREPPRALEKPRDWTWADLMRRVFDLDCSPAPAAGAAWCMIATIEAGEVMRKILGHLSLPTEPPSPLPGRPPPLADDLLS